MLDNRARQTFTVRRVFADAGQIDGLARPIGIETNVGRLTEAYIHPDSGDDRYAAAGGRLHLGQDAAELAVECNDVIRPLEANVYDTEAVQCVNDRNADRERQRG